MVGLYYYRQASTFATDYTPGMQGVIPEPTLFRYLASYHLISEKGEGRGPAWYNNIE